MEVCVLDYVVVGSSPCAEDCVQLAKGTDYMPMMIAECEVFAQQLARSFTLPEGCSFEIKTFSHDFGKYCEVCVSFEEDDELADFACHVENNCPEYWDEEALTALANIPGYVYEKPDCGE